MALANVMLELQENYSVLFVFNLMQQIDRVKSANSLAELSQGILLYLDSLKSDRESMLFDLTLLTRILWKGNTLYTVCDTSSEVHELYNNLQKHYESITLGPIYDTEWNTIISDLISFLYDLAQKCKNCNRANFRF